MEIFRIIAILCLFATQLQANPLPTPQALTFEDLGTEFDTVLKIQKEDQTFKDGLRVIRETIYEDDYIIEEDEDIIEEVHEATEDFFHIVGHFTENAYNKIRNGLFSLFGWK